MDQNVAGDKPQLQQEQVLSKKTLGIFADPQGDFSSGRFIKVFSLCAAVIIAGFLIAGLFIFNKIDPADPAIVNALMWSLGAFLGVAAGSEIVQKMTGR